MKTFLKIFAGVVAAIAIVALIMIAIRMDANTSFLEAGRKWIESIGEGITGGKAAVEEYEEATDAEKTGESAENQGAGTQPGSVEFHEQLTAVDEGGDAEVGGDFYIEDDSDAEVGGDFYIEDDLDESSSTTRESSQGLSAVSADVGGPENATGEQENYIENEPSETYDGLPGTYDEYLEMSRNDRIALAESMGADFEPWLEKLKAHQDDGKIIIIATDQMETVE